MDKKLYYRIMLPISILAICILLLPQIPVRTLLGFLVIFTGFFAYYRLSKKQQLSVQPIYIKKE